MKDRKQYHQEHRDKILEYSKQYHQEHKEKISKYVKQRYQQKTVHCVYMLQVGKEAYIGSTSHLHIRLIRHEYDMNRFKDNKLYKALRAIGGLSNVKVWVLMDGIKDRNTRLALETIAINGIPDELSLNTNKIAT